jgi:ATP-binding cassette, subfamily C (CFTR/MRP), member 1
VLKEYVRQNGGLFFLLVVGLSMTGWLLTSIFSNVEMKQWCEAQEEEQHIYIYLVLAVVASLCAFIRAYTLVHSGFKQGETVHKKIVQSLLYASLNEFYLRVPVGRIMNRLTKDLR